MGIGPVTAARCAGPGVSGKLAMDTMPVTGFALTHPANALVTDSAASATALATGVKTNNGMIAMDPAGNSLRTILEAARDAGKSTGVISTKSVTDATPAAFVSHVPSRGRMFDIAEQMVTSGIDVILGGGLVYFLPESVEGGKRADGRDLLAYAKDRGYDVFSTAEGMSKSTSRRMIGLFTEGSMTTNPPEPSIAEMTVKAMNTMASNPRGFFLMSEGAQIDSEAHGNNTAGVVKQTLLFDDAIRAALDFAKERGDVLVIVTADHDTGGMGVENPDKDNPKVKAGWTTGGHTGNMVPIYAYGPGAQEFAGTHDNTEIAKICARLWGLKLE